MQYKIVGTSHVAKESQTLIKEAFLEYKPQIIAVELDRHRLQGLLTKQKQKLGLSAIRQFGIGGFLFALIGKIMQEKIGKHLGVRPGEEFLYAIKLAKQNDLKVALIDQDINITLRNLKKVPFKEKFKIVIDSIRKKELRKIDLTKVPQEELLEELIGWMKTRYPMLYKVLVDDRNKYMASQIRAISLQHNQKVLAIVGAGHKKGMLEELNKMQADQITKL